MLYQLVEQQRHVHLDYVLRVLDIFKSTILNLIMLKKDFICMLTAFFFDFSVSCSSVWLFTAAHAGVAYVLHSFEHVSIWSQTFLETKRVWT